MLRSSGDAALSMTVENGAGDASGLRTALGWLALAAPLLLIYLVVVWRMHRGRVSASDPAGY